MIYIKRSVILSCLFLFWGLMAFTQELPGKYDIMFKSGNYKPELHQDFDTRELLNNLSQSVNEKHFLLLQFYHIPDQPEREALENTGVTLLDYLPNTAFFASFPAGYDFSLLKNFRVRAVEPIQPVFKYSAALAEKNYPEWALRGDDHIEIRATWFSGLKYEDIYNRLISLNLNPFAPDEFGKTFSVIVGFDEIEKLAEMQFIMYLEAASPAPEPENSTGRTLHRSNTLVTSFIGGRQYDGTGVNVMLQDDGVIGPHIDYEGRIGNQYISYNYGDHGDHCAGIIMASGNLDPKGRGMAPGASIYVYGASPNYPGFSSIPQHYTNPGIRISSTSYSDGCNDGYTSLARTLDMQIRTYPSLMHVFSAGNQGTANCNYGAGAGWGNITGGHKMAKNAIAVANLDYTDNLNSSSSRGPAHDGRIKPDISAKGTDVYSTIDPNSYGSKTGTSMSCPGISGTLAQLYSGYKSLNGGADPRSGLIKAVLLNSADDIGNPGPDFKHGFGRVNALKAIQTLELGRYDSGTINQGEIKNHSIVVFDNTLQLKVMIYWNDREGNVNTTKALVNDLDMTVMDPNSQIWLPWVLDHTPDPARLNAPATRGEDHLNNMEQVTIDNPVAGYYNFAVSGFSIPQGPQQYFVVYEAITDQITVTYPFGGESLVPGETEVIRWDAHLNDDTFTLEYSTDMGENWNLISNNTSGSLRYFSWTVPAAITGKALVRISRNGVSGQSEAPFSIMQQPAGFHIDWACENALHLTWDEMYGADEYEIYQLGDKYMEVIGSTHQNSFLLTGISQEETYWFSIRAKGTENAVSRRNVAIVKNPGTFNCYPVDGMMAGVPSNSWGALYEEMVQAEQGITVRFKNNSASTIENPVFGYSFNNGVPVVENHSGMILPDSTLDFTFNQLISLPGTGNFSLNTWVTCAGDNNPENDTLSGIISLIPGNPVQNGYQQTFESWANCQAIPTCEGYVCPLDDNWINLTNNETDDIDWRTYSGSTPTGQSGPDFDHTTGTSAGKYLFLEASVICFFKEAELLLPLLDLTGTISPKAYIWYHSFGSDIGRFHVDIYNGTDVMADAIPPVIGQVADEWRELEIDLAMYAGQKIAMKLRGVTGGGQKGDFAIDDFMLTDAVGLPESSNPADQMIRIYPNPTRGMVEIFVDNKQNGPVDMEVMDVMGRLLIRQRLDPAENRFSIDLSRYGKGIYLVKTFFLNGHSVKRISVQ